MNGFRSNLTDELEVLKQYLWWDELIGDSVDPQISDPPYMGIDQPGAIGCGGCGGGGGGCGGCGGGGGGGGGGGPGLLSTL